MFKRLLLTVLFLCLTSSTGWSAKSSIRVLVEENSPALTIYAKKLMITELGKEKSGAPLQLISRTTLRPGVSMIADGRSTGWQKIKLSSNDGPVWVNGKSYQGDVVIEQQSQRGLNAINMLPLEKYVTGTLAGEMPSSWPLEALKAQAVTARTYALYVTGERRSRNSKIKYDIRSTVEDQVFKGSPHINDKVRTAVSSTAGETLYYHNKPIKTRFHSTCGGETEVSINVWGEKDVSKRILDPYCRKSPHRNWQTTMSSQEISSRLKKHGFDPGEIRSIEAEKFENGGRVAAVSVHGSKQTVSLTGNNFRRFMGFGKIKSTMFNTSKNGINFTFNGKGFGHGVGMCQWGARGMAEKGHSYKDILKFYYPGTQIQKIY
jgi:stage II sporulation protein D